MKQAILAAILSLSPLAAMAASPSCHDAGRCVCTESVSPKSVIGYNATADGQSIDVNVTCINMRTMSVAYYTLRKEDAAGTYNGAATVP